MSWIRRLFDPYDEVEYLRCELSRLQEKYDRLVDKLVNPKEEKIGIPQQIEELEPLRSGYKPWNQKRAELEHATRLEDVNLRDAALRRKNEQMEKDLGLVDHAGKEQKAV